MSIMRASFSSLVPLRIMVTSLRRNCFGNSVRTSIEKILRALPAQLLDASCAMAPEVLFQGAQEVLAHLAAVGAFTPGYVQHRPVHRGASSRDVVSVGRGAAPAR